VLEGELFLASLKGLFFCIRAVNGDWVQVRLVFVASEWLERGGIFCEG
jgi:hypothetical protein